MDLVEVVKQFGLATGIAVFFIWQYIAANKEHKADLKEIARLATSALDKNTDALEENVRSRDKSDSVIATNSVMLDRVDKKLGRDGA